MSTLLSSKVARVRRHTPEDFVLPSGEAMTDRDYRHLIHACEESPRRAIRVIRQGPSDVQHYIDTWNEGEATQPAPTPTPHKGKGKAKPTADLPGVALESLLAGVASTAAAA